MTREEIINGLKSIAASEGLYDDKKPSKKALTLGETIKLLSAEPCDDADVVTFKVIDTKTGEEPTAAVIQNLAKAGGLLLHDIDEFYLSESGQLFLSDDMGRMTGCPLGRFKVVVESEGEG